MKIATVMLWASIVFLLAGASGQLVVDATGPVRQMARQPTEGSGGGIGRKLPVALTVETQGGAPDSEGRTEVDFVITNSGKADLSLPISPHPADFEPTDPNVTYTLKVLNLSMGLGNGRGPNRKETLLRGGARLYGESSSPASLAVLTPGESIRVRATVVLPSDRIPPGSSLSLVAHAGLGDETVKSASGHTASSARESGSADSQDYPLDYFLSGR